MDGSWPSNSIPRFNADGLHCESSPRSSSSSSSSCCSTTGFFLLYRQVICSFLQGLRGVHVLCFFSGEQLRQLLSLCGLVLVVLVVISGSADLILQHKHTHTHTHTHNHSRTLTLSHSVTHIMSLSLNHPHRYVFSFNQVSTSKPATVVRLLIASTRVQDAHEL